MECVWTFKIFAVQELRINSKNFAVQKFIFEKLYCVQDTTEKPGVDCESDLR